MTAGLGFGMLAGMILGIWIGWRARGTYEHGLPPMLRDADEL